MNRIENNQVTLIGEIHSPFEFSHEAWGEKFYVADLKVDRLSDNSDLVPIMISERKVHLDLLPVGKRVTVTGQFRSYSRHDGNKNRLILSVSAREIENVEESADSNQIFLNGFICKKPIYRKTPLGREITDFLIAVNRPYGNKDYIPCICWGRNARFASTFELGTRCVIRGRIQSRKYIKKLDAGQKEERTAYEASIYRLKVIDGDTELPQED